MTPTKRWNHSILHNVDLSDNHTEEEVKRSLSIFKDTHKGFWYERIYDVKDYVRHCPKCLAPITRCPFCNTDITLGAIPPKRKADYHYLHNGNYGLTECKSSTSKQGFLTQMIKGHQIDSLKENYLCGGRSWLFIGRRDSIKPQLYVLTIGEYLNIAMNRSFIKWEELDRVAKVLDRMPCSGLPYYKLEGLL